MSMRGFGWAWLVLGLALFGGLLAFGEHAVAQTPIYVGDYMCSSCHSEEYASYKKHGHPWMQVHTGGATPADDLFAPIGEPLPALPTGIGWDQVQDIVANFEGEGSFLLTDGRLAEPGNKFVSPMRGTCNKCHNTAGDALGTGQYGLSTIQGTWKLNGIQCEQCHGAGPAMIFPDGQVCRDCHSSGDSKFRIPFDTVNNRFSNHHPQGDEYRRSPHKNLGCPACHDPHKSVWHEEGGVKYAEQAGKTTGTMCTHCHQNRVRGSMGEIGMECVECHMPDVSGAGERTAHLFRIDSTGILAKDNLVTELNDSNKNTVYWKSTDPNGDAFLTLDMVCTKCHNNMTMAQMAQYAKSIHHASALVDIWANDTDKLLSVSKATPISVNFSVRAGAKKGMKADWWVMSQGAKGWSSWNGKTWKAGLRAWRKGYALADVASQNILKSKLTPGFYSYWVALYPTDKTENVVSVPIYVTR